MYYSMLIGKVFELLTHISFSVDINLHFSFHQTMLHLAS